MEQPLKPPNDEALRSFLYFKTETYTGQETSKEIEEEEVISTVFCEIPAAPEIEAKHIEEETPNEEQSNC